MILTPRYDGPTILSVDGHPADQLEPLMRQRRRMQAMLAGLTDDEWMSMSDAPSGPCATSSLTS